MRRMGEEKKHYSQSAYACLCVTEHWRENLECVCVRERESSVCVYISVCATKREGGREGGIRGAGRDEENERAA